MKQKRINNSALFSLILVASVALFCSFTSPNFTSGENKETDIIPLNYSLNTFLADYYEPEFKLEADSVIIPLKRAGLLFLIEATVDGERGNLVFDTGANGLVLNSTYFRTYVKTPRAASAGITGAVGLSEQIAVEKIEFADLCYKNLRADLANLGHIENRRGVKILGLVGFGMMRNLEIIIDPVNCELKLFRIDKTGKRLGGKTSGFKPDYSQKIESTSNILFLKAMIGGKLLNFCFDTGAETNAIRSDANKKIMSTVTITRRTTLKGAGAAGTEVFFGRMNDFTMGDRKLASMETIITNLDHLNEAYAKQIDGMLGYSFIKQGIICVNFVNKQFAISYLKGGAK